MWPALKTQTILIKSAALPASLNLGTDLKIPSHIGFREEKGGTFKNIQFQLIHPLETQGCGHRNSCQPITECLCKLPFAGVLTKDMHCPSCLNTCT